MIGEDQYQEAEYFEPHELDLKPRQSAKELFKQLPRIIADIDRCFVDLDSRLSKMEQRMHQLLDRNSDVGAAFHEVKIEWDKGFKEGTKNLQQDFGVKVQSVVKDARDVVDKEVELSKKYFEEEAQKFRKEVQAKRAEFLQELSAL